MEEKQIRDTLVRIAWRGRSCRFRVSIEFGYGGKAKHRFEAKHGFAAIGDMNIVLIDHPGYVRRCKSMFLQAR